ncbi:MFS transporter [Streptococcus cuniculipharyngis]|uniref:MFS transporter n=1 Tax=Streptococcus cuniculipharyngis TaxID=1562651 RepID=A0A5C5SAW4_9STRE|nr:MFS transporter [Streptococcus cuniculipharyngis]TWS96467.1 MFS transporter [Streptococcus cuniculipharyngis]
MKRFLEKTSLLALSSMLVSTFAVTPALPQMIKHFAQLGISATQVENLITITSFAIMISLLLNGLVVRWLSERAIIVTGLLLMAIGGSMPLIFSQFSLVFLARILLGLGIGLINARAINIISHFFTGKERLQMMGLRGSAEVLGSASLTGLVGLLIGFGWQAAFAVYLFALLILLLFLLFVPKEGLEHQDSQSLDPNQARPKLNKKLWKLGLSLAFLAFFVINVNTFLIIRIPQIIIDKGIGTAQEASYILSLMQLMGILAGTLFSQLFSRLQSWLLVLAYTFFGFSILGIALADKLWLLGLTAMISGFFYSIILTLVFNQASDRIPSSLLNTVMTIVLMGCNIGGATAALVPTYLETISPIMGAFGPYAFMCALISLWLMIKQVRGSQNAT